MRQRFPGFGFALCGPLALLVGGCGASAGVGAKGAVTAGAAPAPPQTEAPAMYAVSQESDASPAPPPAAPTDAPAGAPVSVAQASAPAASNAQRDVGRSEPAPGPARTGNSVVAPSREMLDIEANVEMCAYWVERSAALATALAPQIGYARAAEISKQSVKENVLIRDLVRREQVIPDAEIDDVLDLRKMTEIGVPGGAHGGGRRADGGPREADRVPAEHVAQARRREGKASPRRRVST